MTDIGYDRVKAVEYAREWAMRRNPRYYNFTGIGGDCASFASQSLYAGTGVMNYKQIYGWYYNNVDDRAPAWSSVKYLHQFLTGNSEAGPYAEETDISNMLPGDIIQIATFMEDFHHTLVVTQTRDKPSFNTILICAHSYDSLDRPLSSYEVKMIRCMHVLGARR